MVDRADPAKPGFKSGRLVGVLTAALVVLSLLRVQEGFVGRLESVVRLVGIEPRGTVSVYFYLYIASAAVGRYVLSYTIGALIGVAYDWLDRPSVAVLAGMALLVGLADGIVAAVDTRSILIGVAYVVVWLLYVPLFLRYVDEETSHADSPVRFNDA
jgi:hypothetical protein